MIVQLTDEQIKLIRQIAAEHGLSDYELETDHGSIKGDNYLGIITTVAIKNGEKKIELILKSAHQNEGFRTVAPIREAFLREIFIYDKVFSEFERFQKENNVPHSFLGRAKFYGACDKENHECLLLENLRESGYTLWNRKVPMNPEHVIAVMKEYAKFHATSLAMRNKKPELYKELTKDLENIFEKHLGPGKIEGYIKAVMDSGFKAVESNAKATAALERLASEIGRCFMVDWKNPADQIVVNHGDCWCNNIMFKYQNPDDIKKPANVCLIDWQIAKLGSPAYDLAYFFYACSPKEVLNDYEKYLKIYHDTLSENLNYYSCDAEQIYPYSLLQSNWKTYAKFGMYLSIMIIKVMLLESQEAPDFAQIGDTGKDLLECFNVETVNTALFNQRILDVIESMVEQNLL